MEAAESKHRAAAESVARMCENRLAYGVSEKMDRARRFDGTPGGTPQ
jgi:hypothetical protein